MKHDESQNMYHRARKVLPLGVDSDFRSSGQDTMYISKAEGAYIWDLDGNQYIDHKLGFGPVILGHGYEAVYNKVCEATRYGVTYATSNVYEVSAAERIVAMCPSVDMVRFTNSGTEATMHVVRLARAYTGREKIIKFEGCYHGTHDYLMWSFTGETAIGSIRSPIPVASSSGIPRCIGSLIVTVPYNDADRLGDTLARCWFDVAAIILPPLHTSGAMAPETEWLKFVRSKCSEYGILLIFDEIQTGFRLARGGAAEYFGVMPDLVTYAKAMGNGYPGAAFGGRKEIMDILGQGVSHAGTYNGNVVAAAAADATLKIIKEEPVIEEITERGRKLQEGMKKLFEKHNIPVNVLGHPAQFGLYFGEGKPKDERGWMKNNISYYERFSTTLQEFGVMRPINAMEPWFISYSHTDKDVDEVLNRIEDVLKVVPYKKDRM